MIVIREMWRLRRYTEQNINAASSHIHSLLFLLNFVLSLLFSIIVIWILVCLLLIEFLWWFSILVSLLLYRLLDLGDWLFICVIRTSFFSLFNLLQSAPDLFDVCSLFASTCASFVSIVPVEYVIILFFVVHSLSTIISKLFFHIKNVFGFYFFKCKHY